MILLVTIILAGVAIFTAIRLYQLGNQAVAPNVPSSIPQAAENTTTTTLSTCSLTFTLVKSLQCNSACNLQDSPAQCGQGFSCLNTSGNSNTLILKCRNPQCPTSTNCVCPTPTPGTCDSSCNGTTNPPTTCKSGLRCYYESSSSGDLTITKPGAPGVCRSPSCLTNPDCTCATPSPTPTPTVTPTPTATPGPTGTPNNCGGTCGSNINCNGGLFCYQGFCRNPSCQSQTSCNCPGTTAPTATSKTPAPTTAPSLPKSGTDWPTEFGAGLGVLVIIGSLLLAL